MNEQPSVGSNELVSIHELIDGRIVYQQQSRPTKQDVQPTSVGWMKKFQVRQPFGVILGSGEKTIRSGEYRVGIV